MQADIDAGEHIPLIYRVIKQMGLKGDTAEEAFSESLVVIVEASKTYKPEKGPLASWLAQNIRWSILGWLAKERKHGSFYIRNDAYRPEAGQDWVTNFKTNDGQHPGVAFTDGEPEDIRDSLLSVEVKELVEHMKRILTPREYEVMVLSAVEFSGKQIADKLGMTAVQVTRTKQSARAKLERYK